MAERVRELEGAEFGAQVNLKEYPHEVARLRTCRRFQVDLISKLRMILRAHGIVRKACAEVRVSPRTFRYWLAWRTAPGSRAQLDLIDEAYTGAIEKLAARTCKRRRQRAMRK